ncbi:MAG: ABC transporter permease [Ruminococcus sp.]|uniref:ABC transporter permease n=1 Tax=Ruminococcus sp. TaxID=41978 RepID=UPI0025FF2704|nr:ABC transporter permease [Ruminococcus sp.]MBR5684439.1 ABC transporter permease [Ruminococcus sp.]
MYDEKNLAGGIPEEINYSPENEKKGAPTGVSAPVLDDFGYVAPSDKKNGPTGVAAPVLDDMSAYTQSTEKKGAPTGVSAPVLDDAVQYSQAYEKKGAPTGVTAPVLDDGAPYIHEKLVMTDQDVINGLTPELRARFDSLPADKQQQIIDMRRTQLGAVAPPVEVQAPILDEDNYTPPPKKEEPKQPEAPITAPKLDDEPEPPKYQPKYVDEDLERAKAEASKNAVSAQLVSEQKDSKASLQMMLELKEQARQQQAEKGFKITAVLAVLGIVAAILFYILYSGAGMFAYKGELGGIKETVQQSAIYISALVGILSVSLIAGIGGLKTLTSVVMLLFGIVQIVPGIMMIPQHKGAMPLVILFYAVPLAISWAIFFLLAGSESVGLFFSRKKE